MKEACETAGIVILEPVMSVETNALPEFVGQVLGALNARRGEISGQEVQGPNAEVMALVPLANMFGCASELTRRTRGTGRFTMSFSHYQLVPRNVSGGPDDTFPPAVGMRA